MRAAGHRRPERNAGRANLSGSVRWCREVGLGVVRGRVFEAVAVALRFISSAWWMSRSTIAAAA